jgi:hypothetical protein
MPLLTVTLPEKSSRGPALSDFARRFRTSKEKQAHLALDEIRRQWQLEFVRQQKRLSSTQWPKLSVDYLERKTREYEDNENHPDVRYLTTLKRTGAMLDGYIHGITVNSATFQVTINIPNNRTHSDPNGIRAYVHQGLGGIGKPRGMPRRPFQVERFAAVGKQVLTDALKRK